MSILSRRHGPVYAVVGILLVPVLLFALALGALAWNQTRFIYPGAGRPAPEMQQGWRVERVSATGGRTLPVYLRPGDADRPVVLFLHGNYGSYSTVVSATQAFVAAGLTVVAPEYPGYGGDVAVPTANGLDQAAIAAFDWAVRSGADPSRVVVVGNSLGSAPAIAIAAARRPAGLVLVSAFTDMREMAKRQFPFAPSFLLTDAFDNATALKDVHSPVMVVHGSNDTFVPTEMGRRLATIAGVRPTIVPAGHDAVYRGDTQEAVLAFAERVAPSIGR